MGDEGTSRWPDVQNYAEFSLKTFMPWHTWIPGTNQLAPWANHIVLEEQKARLTQNRTPHKHLKRQYNKTLFLFKKKVCHIVYSV
jgi:hypothetical protein